ncbi:MAG: IS110 family transposase, partial [Candidatus Eisenbacteria bacterium]|nr:IS110 family transposase [Candidatus Eisenbacteria bacterium]
HYWARSIRRFGHDVTLLPAHFVRPYRKGNKTDKADAKAILEAARNEEILPVPIKSVDQQSITTLHRLRSRWMANRTSRINTVRGLLRELGMFIPMGSNRVVPLIRQWIHEPDSKIPFALRSILEETCAEIVQMEDRIRLAEIQLNALCKDDRVVERLRTIPGFGLLTASALIAFMSDAHRFPSRRHFASALGLTPKEYSSGSRRRLGAISKRGNTYLRMLLIHGARTVLWNSKRIDQPDRLRQWALDLQATRGHNIAAVALANKLTRIAWVVWTRGVSFKEVSIDK